MPKYLVGDDDRIVLSPDGVEIAYRLALGESPEPYGIDPFEAVFMVHFVLDFAREQKHPDLQQSAEKVLHDLRPAVRAFEVVVEKCIKEEDEQA